MTELNMTTTVSYTPGCSDLDQGKTILKADQRIHRVSYKSPDNNMEILADDFGNDTTCEFVRLKAGDNTLFHFLLPDKYDTFMKQETGWLFSSKYPDKRNYWLPIQPAVRTYDKFGRIVSEAFMPLIELILTDKESCSVFSIPGESEFIEFAVWSLPWNSPITKEIYHLSSFERQKIFIWGSYTPYSGLKNLYHYLIHGAVYKTSIPWKLLPGRRVYCEVVAHALYVIFHSLWKVTGKKIYQHMKNQLVFSIASRQDSDGAWRHGLWTDDFEVHYRHHCSGIHMLAADYEETHDYLIYSALNKAVEYLIAQSEELKCGTWYLHDSLEKNAAAINKSPFPFLKSRALGKSSSNMLVLNTHLDALVALSRYEEVTGRPDSGGKMLSGVKAAIAVLELKPAEILYRNMFKAIELTFIAASKVKNLSIQRRAIRKLAVLMLIPLLPGIKKIIPRLVMPNGYIDRDLSVSHFEPSYHLINVMDVLRFQKRFKIKMLDTVINSAFDFVKHSGLVESWHDEKNYTLGFWAEAVYLKCISQPQKGRKTLADAVIELSDSGWGLPPSLFGCNPEYIPLDSQAPGIKTENDNILIVNLSTGDDYPEFLLINATQSPQETDIPQMPYKWVIRNSKNNTISAETFLTVPPRDWICLKLT